MKFIDAVKIVHPDEFESWWKGIDKDKDYQKKTDKLLDEDKLTNEPDPSRMMEYLSKVRR